MVDKWEKVRDLSKNIGAIRDWYDKVLASNRPVTDKEKATALIVALVDEGSFRIGNKGSSTGEDPTFGISQLRHSMINISDGSVEMKYRSKKGAKEIVPTIQRKTIRNMDTIAALKEMQATTSGDAPNCGGTKDDPSFFCFIDKGDYKPIDGGVVNSRLKDFTIASIHNFRHLKGTRLLLKTIKEDGGNYRQGIREVAKELGHFRTVKGEKRLDIGVTAEKNYIHPKLVQFYGQGHFSRVDRYNDMGKSRQDVLTEMRSSKRALRWKQFLRE